MEDKKYYCMAQGCENEILEPRTCCSGYDCGCMGIPIDPPFCSNECYDEYMNRKAKTQIAFKPNNFK